MTTNRTLTTIGGLILTAAVALAQDAPPAPPAVPTPAARPARPTRPAPPAPSDWVAPAAPVAAMDSDYPAPVAPPARPARPASPAPLYALTAPAALAAMDSDYQEPVAPPARAARPTPPAPLYALTAPAALAAMDADYQEPPVPPVPPARLAPPAPMAPPAQVASPWPMPAPAVMVNIDTQAILDSVQQQMDNMNFDFSFQKDAFDAQQKALEKVQEKLASADFKIQDKFNADALGKIAMQTRIIGGRGSDESMYQNGQTYINNHQYSQALAEFNNVVAHGGPRAEGALYWKAYVLNKLGQASDAQAAIDTLRKTYPSSRWLDDTKALELEVKQSKGPVSPESETDEEIKVLALNSLMQTDPEKFLPQVESMLKGTHSPKMKRQALIVIAQSSLPKAQQDLEQIARGSNPDLQVEAIRYLAAQKRNTNTPQILVEIYGSTNDPAVKRAIVDSFSGARDKGSLLQIIRAEKDGTLRSDGIRRLGDVDGQPELWQMYQGETTPDGKIAILNAMHRNGNVDKLAEVARTDKDPKVRQEAIRAIASTESGTPMTTLVTLYSSEQDDKVKQSIINNVAQSRDCKPLVDLAKAEKSNMTLKMSIFRMLAEKTKSCPAAAEYLTEFLNK